MAEPEPRGRQPARGQRPRPKPCQWFVEEKNDTCGWASVASVKVRDGATIGVVDLCRRHKAAHDQKAARRRSRNAPSIQNEEHPKAS